VGGGDFGHDCQPQARTGPPACVNAGEALKHALVVGRVNALSAVADRQASPSALLAQGENDQRSGWRVLDRVGG
jgi:hypothetical protein